MSARGLSPIGDNDLSLKETLNSLEKEMISRALREVDGNVSMCARLKVQRTTLIERIKKYSLAKLPAYLLSVFLRIRQSVRTIPPGPLVSCCF